MRVTRRLHRIRETISSIIGVKLTLTPHTEQQSQSREQISSSPEWIVHGQTLPSSAGELPLRSRGLKGEALSVDVEKVVRAVVVVRIVFVTVVSGEAEMMDKDDFAMSVVVVDVVTMVGALLLFDVSEGAMNVEVVTVLSLVLVVRSEVPSWTLEEDGRAEKSGEPVDV